MTYSAGSFGVACATPEGGLRETIGDFLAIEDYTGNLAVVFGEPVVRRPRRLRSPSAARRT
jgi:hypothetical protein